LLSQQCYGLPTAPVIGRAQVTEKVIHGFHGTDGSSPVGPLVIDSAGNLYGVAANGGAGQNGVVFKLTRVASGQFSESVLYSFAGGDDGASPRGGVIFDQAGNLYGVTASGGGAGCFSGCGTVYELSRNSHGHWGKKELYRFTGRSDGGTPQSSLTFDASGNLYGTTNVGGDSSCNSGGCGTVFQLSPTASGRWKATVLHTFTGQADGASPFLAGVIFDDAGRLYGVTSTGGANDMGTVFQLTRMPDGTWKDTVLYAFAGGSDGTFPSATLALHQGALYGATYAGGNEGGACPVNGCGTIFKLAPGAGGWEKSLVYAFQGADGIETLATPAFDRAGNLYGTTFEGGSGPCSVCGTAFELTPSASGPWQETVLHSFGARTGDAGTPEAGVVLDQSGALYGTSQLGGTDGLGTVYQITH